MQIYEKKANNPRQKRLNQTISDEKTQLGENITMCTSLGTQPLYCKLVVINVTGGQHHLENQIRLIKLKKHREKAAKFKSIPQSS